MDNIKDILQDLFEYKSLSRDTAKSVIINLAQGKINEFQATSFLTAYMMRTVTVEELIGFREALLELAIPIDLSDYKVIDMCGTGGDGRDTFNISTLSSFVVAGAGVKVAKHGNYGVSSFCGSSNILESLGVVFSSDQDKLRGDLEEAGICFLHAPLFNPAMKGIAPIRRGLGVRTFFNMLGPLVNPANPSHQMIGVFGLELARIYSYILQDTDKNYNIIHSIDGYDEISLTDRFKSISNRGEAILSPSDLGYRTLDPADLRGGKDVDEAAKIFISILKGEGTYAQNSVVEANAATAINCYRPELSFDDSMELAKQSLYSGSALKALNKLIDRG